MPPTQPPTNRNRALTVALYVNAALLAGVLVALLGRGRSSPFESVALGQPAPMPIAGGAGFYLMPAQLDAAKWGCYVMDVDAQTLVAYQYNSRGPGNVPSLELVAARSFVNDRLLRSYNTRPKPDDVRQIVEMERQGITRDEPTEPTTRPIVPNPTQP